MESFSKEYFFSWTIEKYSYCQLKNGERLSSPEFTADGLKGTVWTINLYPKGKNVESKDFISLFLKRRKNDNGPEKFQVKYEFSVIGKGGSKFNSREWNRKFEKGGAYGISSFVKMGDVNKPQKVDNLTEDTLIVCCKIAIGEGSIQSVTIFKAKTLIKTEILTFILEVENFSALISSQKGKFASKNGVNFSSSMYLTDCSCCEEKVVVEIIPSERDQILSKCNLFLQDASGKAIPCGEADNRFDLTGRGIQKLSLTLTRNAILELKSEYLPQDKLSVLCECVFSSGVAYNRIEQTLYELPTMSVSHLKNENHKKGVDKFAEKLTACSSALDDFQAIYNNQILTDLEVKTATKSFKAHKNILSARSTVFKSMMTNDMKEKNTDCIKIDDLDNDTVHQLLLFLYSDQVENLDWESAIKLYYAADKYEVEKLKVFCSSFLVNNLSVSRASELLLLADTHSDSDLKKIVEDFILEHHEQVFLSDEWENLLETNPLLVSRTMRLKYKTKV